MNCIEQFKNMTTETTKNTFCDINGREACCHDGAKVTNIINMSIHQKKRVSSHTPFGEESSSLSSRTRDLFLSSET